VLKKPGILRGDEAPDQKPGHLGKRKDDPLLQEELAEQDVIVGIDLGDNIGLIIFQGSQPGKVEDEGEVKGGGNSNQEEKK
jgi:hypothetical protein